MYAALGRLCWRRRWSVVTAWAALLVLGFTIGSSVFGELEESQGSSSSESVRGFERIAESTPASPGMVVVVDGRSVDDPATRQAVQGVSTELARLPFVVEVQNAYDEDAGMLRAEDGDASAILVTLRETDDMTVLHERVEDVRAVVGDSVEGAEVLVGGDQAVMSDQVVSTQESLVRGQMIVLPLLLVALLLVFRGFRAAVLPLIGAVTTVAGALLLLLGATYVVDVASYAVDVVALFGLALAVDYSLLMVSRFREEKANNPDVATAVARSVETAGRTIAFSALTVVASLAGLFVFDNPVFVSLALGGIATVLIAMGAGLTLVPALLAILGGRIKPEARQAADDGAFGRLARRVQKRPVVVAVGVGAVLLLAAAPFLDAKYSNGDHRVLPTSVESRQATDVLMERFPGMNASPIQVVADVPATDEGLVAFTDQVAALPDVEAVEAVPLDETTSLVNVVASGATQGEVAQEVVRELRADRPDFETLVTGQAAFLVDFRADVADRLPLALAVIGLATFVLLFLMTGSVLVPLKAIVMNVLSLGATFGALVWIFQNGNLEGLLGFEAFGAIELWVPVVVFVFAFGLSMDYEVFLLSRIKECYDECGDSDRAVANGLQRSGRIITSAAALVIIAFIGFALGGNLGIKEMGVALAIAVAVDATLVRTLLVPATMTLLGDANWWAPPWLSRVHDRFGLSESPVAPPPEPVFPTHIGLGPLLPQQRTAEAVDAEVPPEPAAPQ